jgi:hypothetical protein
MTGLARVLALVLVASGIAYSEQWTGWIADQKCAVAGKYMGGDHNGCVSSGRRVVLVNDADKRIFPLVDATNVREFLGKRVEITGKMKGSEIEIESVTEVKTVSRR